MRHRFSPERTRLTKFLSASNQIVKDLDCPPLPPEGRKNDQPASKLARFGASFLKNLKRAHKAITPCANHKNFVLERTSGGCYHRRAEQAGILNPAFAATACYLPYTLPPGSDITKVTLSLPLALCNRFAGFRRQAILAAHCDRITVWSTQFACRCRFLCARLRLRQLL
jgi:hypothetical protein